MIGVIYARYSSDNQREESIKGQLRECKAFAKKNDTVIISEYEESFTFICYSMESIIWQSCLKYITYHKSADTLLCCQKPPDRYPCSEVLQS